MPSGVYEHKPRTEEIKKKISESLKGRKRKPFTEEHKKRISLSNKGREVWNKGLGKILLVCLQCKIKLLVKNRKGRKFCSQACAKLFNKKSKNCNWKGNSAGYQSKHDWIKRALGRANKCEMCDTKNPKRFEWANVDHKYRRVKEDWKQLCSKCHGEYDVVNELRKHKYL